MSFRHHRPARPRLRGRAARLGIAAALTIAVMAGVGVAAPTSAFASGCGSWANMFPYEYGLFPNLTFDKSIGILLQRQFCSFPDDDYYNIRVVVHDFYANGKIDFAVGLHADSSLGITFGVWHPSVPAGTTWVSPAFTTICPYPDYTDWHSTYPTTNSYGISPDVGCSA